MSSTTAPDPDSDPERTAELPVLDPAAYEDAAAHNEGRADSTDNWPVPPLPPVAARSLVGLPRAAVDTPRADPSAVERLAQLKGELDHLRAEHDFTRDEHARVRARFEEELAQARALVSAATARSEELQRQLTEQADAARTRHGRDVERQQVAAREQVRIAGAMHELELMRGRAAGYLESLAGAELRRALLEQVVLDLEREVEGRQVEIGRVARAATKSDLRARGHDAELAQRAARIAGLEEQLSAMAATLAQRDTQLRELQLEAQGLHDSVAGLQGQVSTGGERVRVLQALAEQRSSSELQQESRFAQLQGERAALARELEAAHAAAATATAQALTQGAELGQLRSRSTELEAALLAERRRVGQLEDELAGTRTQLAEASVALGSAQQQRTAQFAEFSAAATRVKELEQEAAEQLEAVRLLKNNATESSARARELEGDLRAAEDVVHRLESEVRTHNARSEEPEKASQQRRGAVEQVHLGATDTAANPALRAAAQELPAAPPPEPPEPLPEGATRFLIHSSDGREVLHVLGRKTSIGRTPDNDLQIDAQYISRHHAVILAGPVHTIIEDLNSTNGVQVNGRRVTRQALRDGDLVLLGRAQYRFVERKATAQR